MASQESLFPTTCVTMIDALADPASPRWEQFARVYGPIIYTLARRAGLQDNEAEEVVSAVMGAFAHRMRSEFHVDYNRGSFRTYLRTVTRNEISAIRKRRMRIPAPLEGVDVVSETDDPVRQWGDIERQERLAECLRRLRASGDIAPRDYEAFERFALRSMSASETAASLGIPVKRVYWLKHHAIKQLQRINQQLELEFGEA